MKTYPASWQAELDAGGGLVSSAVRVQGTAATVRFWGGYGDLTLGGEVYTGIGDRALVTATGAALGGEANPVTVEISGVDDIAQTIRDLVGLRGAFVRIWRLGFDTPGLNLLYSEIWHRGRLDRAPLIDQPNGQTIVRCEIDSPARTLGRKLGRMGSDADQRLVDGADDCFKFVNVAGEKKLAWGGKPPERAASALPTITVFGMTIPVGGSGV